MSEAAGIERTKVSCCRWPLSWKRVGARRRFVLTLLTALAATAPRVDTMGDLIPEIEAVSAAVEALRSGTDPTLAPEQWSALERLLSDSASWGERLARRPQQRATKLGARAMSDAAQLAIRYDRIETATWCAGQSILLDPCETPHAFYVYGVGLYTTWASATAAADPPRAMVAALQTFTRLATDRAEIANACFVMGVMQHRMHASDPQAAVRSYITAARLQPDHPRVFVNLGIAMQAVGSAFADATLCAWMRLLASAPQCSAELATEIGHLHTQVLSHRLAADAYEMALRCRPADATALLHAANAMRRTGRRSAAMRGYVAAFRASRGVLGEALYQARLRCAMRTSRGGGG